MSTGTRTVVSPSTGASRIQHDYWNQHGNQNCSVTEHRSEQNTARLLEPAREPELYCHRAQERAEHSTTTGTSTGTRTVVSPSTGASRTQHVYWNQHGNQNCSVTEHRSEQNTAPQERAEHSASTGTSTGTRTVVSPSTGASRTQRVYWNQHGNQNCSVTEHRSEQNTARLLEPAREPELYCHRAQERAEHSTTTGTSTGTRTVLSPSTGASRTQHDYWNQHGNQNCTVTEHRSEQKTARLLEPAREPELYCHRAQERAEHSTSTGTSTGTRTVLSPSTGASRTQHDYWNQHRNQNCSVTEHRSEQNTARLLEPAQEPELYCHRAQERAEHSTTTGTSTGTRTVLSPSTGASRTQHDYWNQHRNQNCTVTEHRSEQNTARLLEQAQEPERHRAQERTEHSTTTGTSTGTRTVLSPSTGASRIQHDYWKQLCSTVNEHMNQSSTVNKNRSQHDTA
ncbi:hypothetical protein NDU88_000500 [Pleurodeles waltl]|uniref:Uncharacterized protein n=1 Tax=Pleurodeles waltl TaxID=8319 RepID=A0AAV7KM97_PLEWA|nr:hypothetical protein NDU88_000500 [Pleurodeles waltl]